MHDCPICGMACDCDGEDTWLNAPGNCTHCEYEEGEDDYDPEYDNDLDPMSEGDWADCNR